MKLRSLTVGLLISGVMSSCQLAAPRSAFASGVPCSKQSEKRFALVIGNSYSGRDRVSGIEDARAMAEYLCEIGFSVLDPVLNGDAKAIEAALEELRRRIATAEVVVFFFSGHGYQIKGVNYLLPFDQGDSAIDPTDPQYSIEMVFRSLSGAPNKAVKIVFIDACRSNSDLSILGGGHLGDVVGWSEGLAKPSRSIPPRTLFGFAAQYGQKAASGSPDEVSPYTGALLRSIREPGLEIRQLLARVHDEVLASTRRQQSPKDENLAEFAESFYFRDPVKIDVEIDGADDGVFVVLNGKIVRSRSGGDAVAVNPSERLLPLRAGDNEIVVLVHNQKSYRHGLTWERPEGWSYKVRLLRESGEEIRCLDGSKDIACFEGGEDPPFKDGPHHGRLFEAARAILNVHKETEVLTLLPNTWAPYVWNTEAPFEARDQAILWETRFLNFAGRVHGNVSLKDKVEKCMDDFRRLTDLTTSLWEARKGNPRPFDQFTDGLSDCVQTRIWTALEDTNP